MEVDITGFLLGMFETAWWGGRLLWTAGLLWSIGEGKGGTPGGFSVQMLTFTGRRRVVMCQNAAVVRQILGALQELEAVLLFWARVCFLLLLLVPVGLCCSCPQAGRPQRKPQPQAVPPLCSAGVAGEEGAACWPQVL